ncbi:MAG: ribosome silencing factor [Clostridia bacterium]|nr:ribosome silencing factor [Clostridia bacterium]
MDFEHLTAECQKFLADNGAENICVYNSKNSKATKKIVVATKPDEQDVKKLAKQFQEYIKQFKNPLHTDGIFKGEWVVFDLEEVIVHILTDSTKKKYNLDKMFGA